MPSVSAGLTIEPPLINTASPWATTIEELIALYNCPSTGAITIRTSLLTGFEHDPNVHQYIFYSSTTSSTTLLPNTDDFSMIQENQSSSINTLGYSPIPFITYWKIVQRASRGEIDDFHPRVNKPIILSVTGTPSQVLEMLNLCDDTRYLHGQNLTLMVEINLSCPNIRDKEPPAYDMTSLRQYIDMLADYRIEREGWIRVGVKFPPYTYASQFQKVMDVIEQSVEQKEGVCGIDFFTCCNTLGSCLLLDDDGESVLNNSAGTGLGGMAGTALHPLALGNVATFSRLIDASYLKEVRKIFIIGAGGVDGRKGFDRMRNAGATVVGVGTGLGRKGVGVFEEILAVEEDDIIPAIKQEDEHGTSSIPYV